MSGITKKITFTHLTSEHRLASESVDTTTNMWLSFDEDAVIHDKDPAAIPVSLIIQENKTELLLTEFSSNKDTI